MQQMPFRRFFAIALVTVLTCLPAPARAQAPEPKGWVGVLITTGLGERNPSGSLVFSDYPVVESIDPGSPAEKAGLQAGDVLISINSQDFRKNPIPMSSLLVPGQKILFRYRRNDVERSSTLLVAERPAGTSRTVQLSIIGPAPSGPRRAQAEEGMNRRVLTRMPLPPMVSIAPLAFGTGTPSIGIAGAELTRLNDGLRDVLKVKGDGLFVINVAVGTPAGEAGLKSGDVIVRADRQLVQNPGQLIRLMTEAADNALVLQILRKQKLQRITLRW
jgi:serine protease Do